MGEEDLTLGKRFIDFFEKNAQVKVNTTGIRALVETMSKAKSDEGVLSSEHRSAIHNINGHSSQTSKIWYERESQTKISKAGQDAFDLPDQPK